MPSTKGMGSKKKPNHSSRFSDIINQNSGFPLDAQENGIGNDLNSCLVMSYQIQNLVLGITNQNFDQTVKDIRQVCLFFFNQFFFFVNFDVLTFF